MTQKLPLPQNGDSIKEYDTLQTKALNNGLAFANVQYTPLTPIVISGTARTYINELEINVNCDVEDALALLVMNIAYSVNTQVGTLAIEVNGLGTNIISSGNRTTESHSGQYVVKLKKGANKIRFYCHTQSTSATMTVPSYARIGASLVQVDLMGGGGGRLAYLLDKLIGGVTLCH